MIGYNPPDYFAGTDPYGLTPGGGPPDPEITDGSAMRWIRRTLDDSGLFEWVGRGAKAGSARRAGGFPAAWVWPVGFTEADDTSPELIVRTLRYACSIATRPGPDGDEDAQDELDRLSNAVADLLTGQSPPGAIPGLSRVDAGSYDSPVFGSTSPVDGQSVGIATVKLTGTVGYFVAGRGGRSFP